MGHAISDSGSTSGILRVAPTSARSLVDAYRDAARTAASAHHELHPLVQQAANLLGETPRRISAIEESAISLTYDADDLLWRIDYIERTDGILLERATVHQAFVNRDWSAQNPRHMDIDHIVDLLATAENQQELVALVEWLVDSGMFEFADLVAGPFIIDEAARPAVAGAIVQAYENGWRPSTPFSPAVAAGLVRYGNPSDATTLSWALGALDDESDFSLSLTANPFGLGEDESVFDPFADHYVANPVAGQAFINQLLDEHDATGDTRLNMHDDTLGRTVRLGDIVIAAGMHGTPHERAVFVDRLVNVLNADGNTNDAVFWSSWEVYAMLASEHGINQTAPTFDTHHLMPDWLRPHWEPLWNETLSPDGVERIMGAAQHAQTYGPWVVGAGPALTVRRWWNGRDDIVETVVGNDPGGTYSTREKLPFTGSRFHFDDASAGRNAIVHALRDGSDVGDIAADEFAIISHGTGPNGKPTYTINLPGVTDLSKPSPGWDPVHATVRDIDQAAAFSAHSNKVEDNLYAQMVMRALLVNEVPRGANLMIVGHSFGADTAADLAADGTFTERYNLTHVVAAAYDSVPQLADIDPSIEVLVLQNDNDYAIKGEILGRLASSGQPSVSINTFAHDVRVFDGGTKGVGHHQDNYNEYLYDTNDPEITTFYESITNTGYTQPGESFAVDVTLDESLL